MKRVIVKFIRHWNVYQVGEVASFIPGVAKNLVDREYAVYAKAAKEEADGQKLKGVVGESAGLKAIMGPQNTKDVRLENHKGGDESGSGNKAVPHRKKKKKKNRK